MLARIYRPSKTAMQSGRAGTRFWRLEFAPSSPRTIDPLMGWTSSADMRSQVRLKFDTEEEAVAYCVKHNIPYEVEPPQTRTIRPKAYADNFR
jgi:NADH dehydrogenase ubiquinone Fe-S protein 4